MNSWEIIRSGLKLLLLAALIYGAWHELPQSREEWIRSDDKDKNTGLDILKLKSTEPMTAHQVWAVKCCFGLWLPAFFILMGLDSIGSGRIPSRENGILVWCLSVRVFMLALFLTLFAGSIRGWPSIERQDHMIRGMATLHDRLDGEMIFDGFENRIGWIIRSMFWFVLIASPVFLFVGKVDACEECERLGFHEWKCAKCKGISKPYRPIIEEEEEGASK